MADVFTREKRSEIMRSIKGKNTKPEMFVRRALHAAGYRFRTNVRGMPGTPDVLFTKRRAVVQVHGCFWHSHDCDWGHGKRPKTNKKYWHKKLDDNVARDLRSRQMLEAMGFSVAVVWECDIAKRPLRVVRCLKAFLGARRVE